MSTPAVYYGQGTPDTSSNSPDPLGLVKSETTNVGDGRAPTAGGANPGLKIDAEKRAKLGAMLASRFKQYETDRRLAELKWERNARQYIGVYDNEVERNIDKNRSRAYPKLTRWKCVSMRSRLMELLFPADDKNWTVDASVRPNLPQDDLAKVLTKVTQDWAAQGGQGTPSDPFIESAIRGFARERARKMELAIEDQLQDLGGSHACDWVHLSRQVLNSGVIYGCGILKGPFAREEIRRTWDTDAGGQLVPTSYTAYRPHFEWVPIWDYYPDMAAKYFNQMDGQFERIVMSRHQVIKLKDRPDFFADQIDECMKKNPDGNYKRKAFETELRALGVQINVTQSEKGKFEALVWEGFVNAHELVACGVDVPSKMMGDDVRACVWIMDGFVVKAQLDPWTSLNPEQPIQMYHPFIFEEDESFILGNGLPQIVRDSQMGLAAVARISLDNAAVQRVFELNKRLLTLDADMTTINPDQIFYRDDESPSDAQYSAIKCVDIPMHVEELQSLKSMFLNFADSETFVNPATGGDMSEGPSEPFRTAAGASMLRGDAALPFKDVVRNFDKFTESVIGATIAFNKLMNNDPDLAGDFMPVARGATSLIAKEVLGIQLDSIAQTLTPEEKQYLNTRELLRARLRVRDMDVEDLVYDDAKCDQIDAQTAQQQQQQQQMMQEQAQAAVREILSNVAKNLTQAEKNDAAATVQSVNAAIAAMEKGLHPAMIGALKNGGVNGTEGIGASLAGAAQGTGGAAGGNPSAALGIDGTPAVPAAPAAPSGPSGFQPAAMPAGGSGALAGTGAAG